MKELYNITNINNELKGPFILCSTVKTSVNFTIQEIEFENKEIIINEE